MGIFRDLSKLIPNSNARSVARKVGEATDKAIANEAKKAVNNGGKKESTSGSSESSESSEDSDENHSTGIFSVFVPKGWEISPFYSSGKVDPNVLGVHKGAATDYSGGLIPGMQISYRKGTGERLPIKSFYNEVEDMEPITIGSHTWEGFTSYQKYTDTVFMPLTIIWTTIGNDAVQVGLFAPRGERDIVSQVSLDDADVIDIIASIKAE